MDPQYRSAIIDTTAALVDGIEYVPLLLEEAGLPALSQRIAEEK